MRWPWQRKASGDRLVLSWAAQTLAYVQAREEGDRLAVRKMGVLRQGSDSLEDFMVRAQALGLHGAQVSVMLRAEQYQLLQIDAPQVPPEELRQAARYQIREMVDQHVDDLTLDVLKVGDGSQKSGANLYVVVAANTVLRDVQAFCQALDLPLQVIDIQDLAHRNLQTALAADAPTLQRAHAALLFTGDRQALLTISAQGELYYSRRLDVPDDFWEMDWSDAGNPAEVAQGYTPVGEYVPDYGGGSASFDYGSPALHTPSAAHDGAQRLLVEVQRSLDLWDRTWSALPLAGLRVSAGSQSDALAAWLSREMGQTVGTLVPTPLFDGLDAGDALAQQDAALCLPLLGALLRTDTEAP